MSKATRVEHRWHQQNYEKEIPALIVTYQIEGRDERLHVKTPWYGSSTTHAHREDIESFLLTCSDEVAEWCAERPDVVPAVQWVVGASDV